MQDSPRRLCRAWAWWVGQAIIPAILLVGCKSQTQPVYQDKQGFRFTPPPGWAQRNRDDALPAKFQRSQNVPLPPLGAQGKAGPERLLARYDRLTSGHPAWLQVTLAELPSAVSLTECVSARSPAANWKRASEVEGLQVRGLPAARIVFEGRWIDQDYVNETVAVRKDDNVYIVTASFPAADDTAREQVRQAIAGATWGP